MIEESMIDSKRQSEKSINRGWALDYGLHYIYQQIYHQSKNVTEKNYLLFPGYHEFHI